MLGAVREDEAGCSAAHLRKPAVLEIFELPNGTLVRSAVLLLSSLTIFNTLEPLLAAMKLYLLIVNTCVVNLTDYQPESSSAILVLQLLLSQATH